MFNLFANSFNRLYANSLYEAETVIHNLSQVYLREAIAMIESQEINETRSEIFNADNIILPLTTAIFERTNPSYLKGYITAAETDHVMRSY